VPRIAWLAASPRNIGLSKTVANLLVSPLRARPHGLGGSASRRYKEETRYGSGRLGT
jgi:hypothetical protein